MNDLGSNMNDMMMGGVSVSSPVEISIVIPAYNEQECIADCVREVHSVLMGINRPFEIIVVDDGSTDATAEALRRLQREMDALRIVRFKRNCGQTSAMAAGFERARGDIVVTLDADMQNDPADIPAMLEKLKDWDVVCGVRVNRADSIVRRLSSRIANGVRNCLTGERVTDTGCTLKVYRREFLARVKFFEGMHRFLPTLLRLAGARVTEIPVNHRPRLKGKTKYNIRNRVFRSFRDLLAVRWMQSRWIRPEIDEE